MSWSKRPNAGQNGGNFLKLGDGESAVGVLRGAPRVYYAFWNGKTMVECGIDHEGASFRFRTNFVQISNNALVPKLLDGGGPLYDLVTAIGAADYDIENTVVRLTRKGIGKATTYTLMPSPKPLPDVQKKALSEVKLFELKPVANKESFPETKSTISDEYPEGMNDEDVPF